MEGKRGRNLALLPICLFAVSTHLDKTRPWAVIEEYEEPGEKVGAANRTVGEKLLNRQVCALFVHLDTDRNARSCSLRIYKAIIVYWFICKSSFQ